MRYSFVLALGVILFSLFSTLTRAAELYLFSAKRYSTGTPQGDGLSISLNRLRAGRLVAIPRGEEPPKFLNFVIADSELRLLVMGGSLQMPTELQFISMDMPDSWTSITLGAQGSLFLADTNLTDLKVRGPLLLLRLLDDKLLAPTQVFKAYDTGSGKWAAFSPESYPRLRITGGTAGYAFADPEGLRSHGNGQLVLVLISGNRELPFGPPLPPALRYPTTEYPDLWLNDTEMAVVSNAGRRKGDDKVVFRLLDKRRNEWTQLIVPGDKSFNVRAFGPWMAGIIAESQEQDPKTFRLSPGRRMPGMEGLFRTIDEYLYLPEDPFYSLYRPGKLFLYNVQTRRYYEWDTHDGDCEVLLVEDGQVYYRVDQAIYRAKIGEKELERPELLVEDEAVRGIHWAFFGPKGPVQPKPSPGRE